MMSSCKISLKLPVATCAVSRGNLADEGSVEESRTERWVASGKLFTSLYLNKVVFFLNGHNNAYPTGLSLFYIKHWAHISCPKSCGLGDRG